MQKEELEWYRTQMLNQLWILGGVSLPFYSCYLNHLSLFDEDKVRQDAENIQKLEKGSLDAKFTNLLAAMMPRESN